MILSAKQLVKYSCLVGSVIGLLLTVLIPLYGEVKKPWPSGEIAVENQFPEEVCLFLSYSELNKKDPSGGDVISIKQSEYLVFPSLTKVIVVKYGKEQLEIKKAKISILYILAYPLALIALFIAGLKLPDK